MLHVAATPNKLTYTYACGSQTTNTLTDILKCFPWSKPKFVCSGSVVEEDLADSEFRSRHDRYEITEKKKYMAYMEWSINKKNGTR